MWIYLLKRVIQGIPVLFLVATLTFVLMRIVPGGPFDRDKKLPPEILANIEAKYHLDQPVWRQYLIYMKEIGGGDFGPSYKYVGRDVNDIICDTFPVSLILGLLAMTVMVVIGIPAGVFSAYWRDSWMDHGCIFIATLGVSVPNFVLGSLLVLLFAHHWHLLPPALWEGPRHALLPAITLGAGYAGYIARLTRSTVLEALEKDYIRTARAKGLGEGKVLSKHVLGNSMAPIVSVLGPLAAGLVTGSFIIEYIYSIPGMGSFFITAVTNRDYPLIMGVTMVYASVIVTVNIAADLMYVWLDPRVRLDK
tara:strand:- start:5002 stop:5922 length:921 start_codon:yes stop_codon:yes gene_type:complete